MGDAIAELFEQNVLEYHVSGAAIGWRFSAHLRCNERVRRLAFGSRIPAPRNSLEVHRLSVRPNAADAGNGALAQSHCERAVIEIGGGLDLWSAAALTSTALAIDIDLLAEIRRPDDVAADFHAAIHPRDDCALSRTGDLGGVESRPFYALVPRARNLADHPTIHH